MNIGEAFSSPSRGSYISTNNSIAYPFRVGGSYISTHQNGNIRVEIRRSRPLPGVLISLLWTRTQQKNFVMVLVPFPGFLYLYGSYYVKQKQELWFSSPSRGSYISTVHQTWERLQVFVFSSPSRGSYISTLQKTLLKNSKSVLVPFPGFLYLYGRWLLC